MAMLTPHAGLEQHHYYQTNPDSMTLKKLEDIESSGIYDQVGPPNESKFDSVDHKFPNGCSRHTNDELPAIPPPRCNTYEVPVESIKPPKQERGGNDPLQSEACNTYEVPVDSSVSQKGGVALKTNPSDPLQSGETYDVPLEQAKVSKSKHDGGGDTKSKASGPLQSEETYEVPLEPVKVSKPEHDGGGDTKNKPNSHLQSQESRKELEVSNVYETPTDATKRKEAAVELDGDQEYTPMASVWNYTQYKRT